MAKKALSTLNLGNIDGNFVVGINKGLALINRLARLEKTQKDASDSYKIAHGYDSKVATDTERKDYKDYMKSYTKATKDARDKADALCTLILTKYTDFDFTAGDYTIFSPSALESFLKNIGVLVGNLAECKDKQKDTATEILKVTRGYLKLVTDRRTATMARRAKGTDYLTYKDSKEIRNTSIEYILALVDGLTASGVLVKENTDTGIQIANRYA